MVCPVLGIPWFNKKSLEAKARRVFQQVTAWPVNSQLPEFSYGSRQACSQGAIVAGIQRSVVPACWKKEFIFPSCYIVSPAPKKIMTWACAGVENLTEFTKASFPLNTGNVPLITRDITATRTGYTSPVQGGRYSKAQKYLVLISALYLEPCCLYFCNSRYDFQRC